VLLYFACFVSNIDIKPWHPVLVDPVDRHKWALSDNSLNGVGRPTGIRETTLQLTIALLQVGLWDREQSYRVANMKFGTIWQWNYSSASGWWPERPCDWSVPSSPFLYDSRSPEVYRDAKMHDRTKGLETDTLRP
jgi:hypothetical protein